MEVKIGGDQMVSAKFMSDPEKEELAKFGALIRQKSLSVEDIGTILRAYPVEIDVQVCELGGSEGYEIKGKYDESGIKDGIAIIFRQRVRKRK
ncbi:MAG: hypothetical protein ACOCNL_15195 [Acetivibrio ethanolgignens]